MRLMQSFLMLFYILDQCYDQCQENDLGGFLGAISPDLWEDGRPINKAVYNDWKAKTDTSSLDGQNIVNAITTFIEDYETKFGYCFTKTKELLKNTVSNEMLIKAQVRTEKMYQKNNYVD